MARFSLRATSTLILGEGGFLFHVIPSEIAISDFLNGTLRPPLPPPRIKDAKWRVFLFARLQH